ncbi:unnamed protein product [Dicrocoelium dendriticum]|nr:unnamed protein product [Dicrocoelium dendriticum]
MLHYTGLVRVCVWVNGDHVKPFPCCLIRASENIPANRDVPVTGSISDLLSSSPTRPAIHARNAKNPASEQKSNTLSATGTVTPAPPYQNSPHGRSIFTDASYKLPSVDYTCNTELTNLSLDSRTDDLKLPDLETDSASHESSISSSSLDDFGTRNRPKKPRPVYDTFNVATTGIRTMLSLKRAWANLSYWESNHHVAKGWFSLDDPVTYILYAEGISKHSPKSSSGRPGDHFSCVRHCRDASYIRLFPLVTQPSPRPHIRTICSTKLPGFNDSNFTHTAQKRYSFFFPTDSRTPARSSTSWRQCYRLGGSGLVLSLTPHGRIWLDNQAIANNLTVFVSSPCLSRGSKSTNAMCWPVRRVPSGFSIVIFDLLAYQRRLPESFRTDTPSLAKASRSDTQANLISSLVHHPLVHISLGKGWGPGYRRPDITHCPARLELWINTDSLLGLIDK